MSYEIYGRICVGAPLIIEAATTVHAEWLASPGLPADAPGEAAVAPLRLETQRHKLHEPDRVRYERAFEAFLDERWSVDCAFGGPSRDGLFDPRKGFIFVGVRVEQFEITTNVLPRGAAVPEKPQWLTKGDL